MWHRPRPPRSTLIPSTALGGRVAQALQPGGVPISRNGRGAGGVGVAGVRASSDAQLRARFLAGGEFAASRGGTAGAGLGPRPAPPQVIFIDGIALPFV